MKSVALHIGTINIHLASPSDLVGGKSIGVLGTIEEFAGAKVGYGTALQRFEFNKARDAVTDHKTGLVWAANESDKRLDFADAEAYVASLNLGGFSDWRLPDLEELESIRDLSRHEPCINTDFFQSNSSYVWSRTPCAWSSDRAWVVLFDDGGVDDLHRYGTAFVRPVRAVSAGQ